MTPALVLAFTLMTAAPADDGGGEPLPPGAPTDSYELGAWCYGALNEYLLIYDEVKPDLRDIDRMFGTSVVETEPYQSDMAAARDELKMIGDAVTDAEKASPRPIAERGAASMRQGEAIWSLAEGKPHRELARAWMLWALPDACDSNARELMTKSLILGKALSYNSSSHAQLPAPSAPRVAAAPAPTLSALEAANHAAPAIIEAPAPAPTAEAAPPPAAPLPAPPAPGTPVEQPAASLVAAQPEPPAAESAAPPPPASTPAAEVVSVQPAPPPAAAIAPTPGPPAATAQQSSAPPTIAPPGPDQPQEPTL